MDGPAVGGSSGFPTTYGMGAAQEVGLQFLENAMKAKKILLYGTSLGGGAQSEGILTHDFKKDVQYMVWSDRTFDTLSHTASQMVTPIAEPLFWLLGISLNGVAAGQRLKELNIKHIITQNSLDSKDNILPHENLKKYNEKGSNDVLQKDFITEYGSDGVIPNPSSLYVGLRKAGINDQNRIKFFGNSHVRHNGSLDNGVSNLVHAEVTNFFND